MLKLETNIGVMCIGVVSSLLTLGFAFSLGNDFWEYIFFFVTEFFGGIGLVIGVIKQNHKFVMPRLIGTTWLIFILSCLMVFFLIWSNDLLFFEISMPVLGVLVVPLCSVAQASERIRKERDPTANTCNV